MGTWEKKLQTDLDKLRAFLNESFPEHSLASDGNNKLTFLQIESLEDKQINALVEEMKQSFPLAFQGEGISEQPRTFSYPNR